MEILWSNFALGVIAALLLVRPAVPDQQVEVGVGATASWSSES